MWANSSFGFDMIVKASFAFVLAALMISVNLRKFYRVSRKAAQLVTHPLRLGPVFVVHWKLLMAIMFCWTGRSTPESVFFLL
jgi:hypothetical protein